VGAGGGGEVEDAGDGRVAGGPVVVVHVEASVVGGCPAAALG